MDSYSHLWAPLKLHVGEGSLDKLARDLDRAGVRRALVVTSPTLAADAGIMEAITNALGARLVGIHSGARPHSPIPSVLATAQVLADSGADGVVALGGGSAVVTARAAAIALAEGQDLRALATSRTANGQLHSPRLERPKLPQFVVPTTPVTAMVKAGSAVLDPNNGERLALFDPKTRAQSVALDSRMLGSAPRALVLEAGLGVLMLSIEGLMARGCDPVAEALLVQAVRQIWRALKEDLNAPCTRADLAVAAAMAGRGTDHVGGGIAGVLGHAVGPRFHLANARVIAVVLPAVIRFNAEVAADRIALAAWALGGQGDADDLAAAMAATRDRLGLAGRLRDLDVPADLLPEIARAGMGDWSLRGAPRQVTDESELLAILRQVW